MKNRIKQIRKDKKLTQVEFGEKIGVKGNTITNYETGLRNPTDAVILSICREFHVNEEWLRTGSGEPYKDSTRDEQIAAAIASIQSEGDETFKYRLISALTQLNESDWEVLSRLIDSISSKE